MQRVADTITARLDSHEKAILDLQRWRDEAAGAIRLARWALGASLVASALMVLQIAALISHAEHSRARHIGLPGRRAQSPTTIARGLRRTRGAAPPTRGGP